MRNRGPQFWFFASLYAVAVTGGTYGWYSGTVPDFLRMPWSVIEKRVNPPSIEYYLTTVACTGGRSAECQQLVKQTVYHGSGTTTVVVDETLTERYEAAGGRAPSLTLLTNSPDGQYFYLEEQFPSSRPRQLYRLEGESGVLTVLSWSHNPFAGDRISQGGRYLARASADFTAIEFFDVFTLASGTPFRLSTSTETLASTECGFAGKNPRFTWVSEGVLSVDIFAREPVTAGACAGPLLRTVRVVVE